MGNFQSLLNEAADVGLQAHVDAGVLRLTLDRPQAGNSLTPELIAAMIQIMQVAEQQRGVRALVLTGVGTTGFCGGSDLKGSAARIRQRAAEGGVEGTSSPFAKLLRVIRDLQLVTIARVNGSAAGGGVGLLGVMDFVVAVDSARFAISEIKVGFFPTQVVSALWASVSRRTLIDMCMTGRKIDAAEALGCGLVGKVVPAALLDAAIDELLESLREVPLNALRRGRHMLRAIDGMSFEESLSMTETVLRLQMYDPDTLEGVAAYGEKRAPIWRE